MQLLISARTGLQSVRYLTQPSPTLPSVKWNVPVPFATVEPRTISHRLGLHALLNESPVTQCPAWCNSSKMIVSFFPDSVWGCTVKQHQKQKHLLYHKIIYTLISDKYKNRILRKSSFALLYLSYVFIKMLPVTLAIETHTGTKSITSLAAKTRPLPEMVAPPLDDEDDDYFDDYVDEYDIVNNKSGKCS